MYHSDVRSFGDNVDDHHSGSLHCVKSYMLQDTVQVLLVHENDHEA